MFRASAWLDRVGALEWVKGIFGPWWMTQNLKGTPFVMFQDHLHMQNLAAYLGGCRPSAASAHSVPAIRQRHVNPLTLAILVLC